MADLDRSAEMDGGQTAKGESSNLPVLAGSSAIVPSAAGAGGGELPVKARPSLLAKLFGKGGLTPEKETAIGHLAAGASVSEAARLAGVNRTTLHRWMRQDADFVSALNAWRNEMRATARNRLLAALPDAVDAIQAALRKGDGRLALSVVKLMAEIKPEETKAEADEDPAILKEQLRIDAECRKTTLKNDKYNSMMSSMAVDGL